MGILSRDRDDHRSAREVIDDVSHDLYHRGARLDRGHSDGKTDFRHAGDCEWTRKRAHDERSA